MARASRYYYYYYLPPSLRERNWMMEETSSGFFASASSGAWSNVWRSRHHSGTEGGSCAQELAQNRQRRRFAVRIPPFHASSPTLFFHAYDTTRTASSRRSRSWRRSWDSSCTFSTSTVVCCVCAARRIPSQSQGIFASSRTKECRYTANLSARSDSWLWSIRSLPALKCDFRDASLSNSTSNSRTPRTSRVTRSASFSEKRCPTPKTRPCCQLRSRRWMWWPKVWTSGRRRRSGTVRHESRPKMTTIDQAAQALLCNVTVISVKLVSLQHGIVSLFCHLNSSRDLGKCQGSEFLSSFGFLI